MGAVIFYEQVLFVLREHTVLPYGMICTNLFDAVRRGRRTLWYTLLLW